MRKIWIVVTMLLMTTSLVGCKGYNNLDNSTDSSYESASYEEKDSIDNNSTSKSTSSDDEDSSIYESKTIEHYCDADGCSKEGTKTMTGFSGETEYYCYEHYNEIQEIISSMEEDVGNGTASKHQCEECSKEGTNELIGFSGETEYYCTEHYNNIVEILEMMLEE